MKKNMQEFNPKHYKIYRRKALKGGMILFYCDQRYFNYDIPIK